MKNKIVIYFRAVPMRTFTLFIFLIFLQNLSFSQDKLMALRQSKEQGFLFIDFDGNEMFQLPAGHDPSVRQKKDPFKLGNFYTVDFSSNVLPVQYEEHYYLINKQGKKIKKLADSLNWVSPFQQGFFRAFERHNGQRNSSMIVYLDREGNECFGGKRFWEGSQFRDGHAIVQLENREGPWLLIDTLGKTVAHLTDSISPGIRSYTFNQKKLWKITYKHENWYKHTYVRPSDGAISISTIDLLPPLDKKNLSDVPNTGLEVDQRIERRLNKLPFMTLPDLYQNEHYGYYLFDDRDAVTGENIKNLYDHHYQLIPLPKE